MLFKQPSKVPPMATWNSASLACVNRLTIGINCWSDSELIRNSPPLFTYLESCNIRKGKYIYTDDLWALHNASGDSNSELSHPLKRQGPLPPIEAWFPVLKSHSDQGFAQYLYMGLTEGFRIGFKRSTMLRPLKGNQKSVAQNPEVVSQYLRDELATGRLNGPFALNCLQGVHCSPIGIIPKPNKPGKWSQPL